MELIFELNSADGHKNLKVISSGQRNTRLWFTRFEVNETLADNCEYTTEFMLNEFETRLMIENLCSALKLVIAEEAEVSVSKEELGTMLDAMKQVYLAHSATKQALIQKLEDVETDLATLVSTISKFDKKEE